MNEPVIEYWTPEEHFAGLCTEQEIGKVKGPMVEARRLAQRATPKAIKALVETMEQTEDLNAKVKAAQVLLDRGWGKPDQHTTSDNTTNVVQWPAWLTARRLAYQESNQVIDDIALPDARAAAPRALANAPSAAPAEVRGREGSDPNAPPTGFPPSRGSSSE